MNKTKHTKQVLANEKTLKQVLDTLIDVNGGQPNQDQIQKSIATLRKLIIKAQKQPEIVTSTTVQPVQPMKLVAWAIMDDDIVIEVIHPDQHHGTYEYEYTTPFVS